MKKKIEARYNELSALAKGLVERAQMEKRRLTDDEQTQYDGYLAEMDNIKLSLRADEPIPQVEVKKESLERRFAEDVTKIVESGGKREFEVRAAPITEVDIHDGQVPVLLSGIIEPLQNKFILNQLGCKIMSGVHGEPVWSLPGIVTASVEGENTKVADSTIEFAHLRSKPKRIAVSVPVSRRAISQSNYDLMHYVTSAMGEAAARKINEALLSASAVGELKGAFLDLDSKNALTAPGDWSGIVDLETAVLNQNVDVMNGMGAYVFGTKVFGELKKTVIEKGDSKMTLDVNAKTINGHRYLVSNYVPDKTIYFGDFSNVGVAYYNGASFIIDPYTRATENIICFVLNMDVDIVRFRKEAFAKLTVKPAIGG